LNEPVYCDGNRLADLLSNLLGNALAHGNVADPVFVDAMTEKGDFVLSVMNTGDQIPEQLVARLFEPFARGQVKKGQDGLGLGLYIASEIAHAHNGTIEVVSNEKETSFTFKMPAQLNELNN
jgi:signal transduction histidine kinase